MKGLLYHLQLNVSDLGFYRDLFSFLEYRVIDQSADHLGITDGHANIWIIKAEKPYVELPYHRKAIGLNHLAFVVGSNAEVDHFCREFLGPRKIQPLYSSPKSFTEYHPNYYAVYFEDPDRIKLEVVCRLRNAPAS